MIRVSSKFAAALMLCLGAAAALRVTALSGARGVDSCASPGGLKATSLIAGSAALGERREALDGAIIQWSEGHAAHPLLPALPMDFQIIRSYDAPALYNNPIHFSDPYARAAEAAARNGEPVRGSPRLQPEELRVREAEAHGIRLPIHLAWDHTDAQASRLVAWFFVFDNEPVRSPVVAQLKSSLGLALGGPRPLTLVTLSAVAPPQASEAVEGAAVAWLTGAWSYIARTCAPR